MTGDPLYLRCDCYEPHHCWVIDRDPDVDGSFDISFVAESNGWFWHRVKWALRHVFKRDMLVVSDMILSKADAARLIAYLTEQPAA